jgi:hypothetical protein
VEGAFCAAVGYETASTNGHARAIVEVEVDHHGAWSLDLAVGELHLVYVVDLHGGWGLCRRGYDAHLGRVQAA